LEHLFQAASALDKPRLRVVIAGGPVAGDEAYAAALLKGAKELLGDRLLILGHLTDLRAFYNGLDVFVNTSQEEACSISVMEALACGCPVLGYPSKSVDGQVLPHGGEIVPQDDVTALTTALDRWLSEPSWLAVRRAWALRTAQERFDIKAISAQLWREYQDVLGESH
jgi:glycosyltransferase involved in cell wall biosynthesis